MVSIPPYWLGVTGLVPGIGFEVTVNRMAAIAAIEIVAVSPPPSVPPASPRSRTVAPGPAARSAKTESGRVLAPHVLVFPGKREVTAGYGDGTLGRGAELFDVPVIDEDAAEIAPESRMLRAGVEANSWRCSLPRAAVAGKAGLFVTCFGEDAAALFDADALNPHDVELKRSVPAGPRRHPVVRRRRKLVEALPQAGADALGPDPCRRRRGPTLKSKLSLEERLPDGAIFLRIAAWLSGSSRGTCSPMPTCVASTTRTRLRVSSIAQVAGKR
jgi:hypothetical protein